MESKKNKTLKEILNTNKATGIVCALPFIIGFLMFMLVPMGLSLYYSFCDYNITSPAVFSGMKNYIKIFTGDDKFYNVMWVTIKYSVLSVPLKLIFALIVAMILFRQTKVTGIYRVVYYVPSIIGGSVAVAVLWKRMFSTDGVINSLLAKVGVQGPSWLGDTRFAIWVLILLTVWQFGSSMLIFLSALKQIPTSLYEAAQVDGANKWTQFWQITLPLLTPNIHFNMITQTINGFLAFTQCHIITQGKPLDSTLFYAVYMYNQSFQYYNTGYGAALAWVMLIVVALITWLLFATKKFWVYEGGF